ncbi:hypothetical protein CHS0354_000537 [Potamilus streckersoni]|uniref:DNA mismatch repair proteins mutS family domain-containing protein n=1 Tax=Potamilus streckersoni TaxID=2493646 RepID=A0AAE0W8D3_9BIVA|nr:hypothetical protein CHS0354_000537 [Potamilus streckersoni]
MATELKKDVLSPLMRQHAQIKSKHPNVILLFRVGDFYETFGDDAIKVSEALDITLTKRANGVASEVPLAGFPHHSLNTYLPRLVKYGFRVAVCDQMEDPRFAKGIVRREVVEIVTPGVSFNDSLIDVKRNNYLCCIHFPAKLFDYAGKMDQDSKVGVAFIDVTTAEFEVLEISFSKVEEIISIIRPSELIISKAYRQEKPLLAKQFGISELAVVEMDEWMFNEDYAYQTLLTHFKVSSLKGFGIEEFTCGKIAASAVLHYLEETQKGKTDYIKSISKCHYDQSLAIDEQTKKNLEIIETMNGSKKSTRASRERLFTLHGVIDQTLTPMGARLFYKWVNTPLSVLKHIQERLDAVEIFFKSSREREDIRSVLKNVSDLERLMSRVSTQRANPRQVLALGQSLNLVPELKRVLETFESQWLKSEVVERLHDLGYVTEFIFRGIDPDAPVSLSSGFRIIKKGFSEELDELYDMSLNAKDKLIEIQENEREKTGITSLKVQYNKAFGYSIEITHANKSRVPAYYERKQTMTHAERYVIPELKEYEMKILTAEEKAVSLEAKLFASVLAEIAKDFQKIIEMSRAIGLIDVIVSLAEVGEKHGYVKPFVTQSNSIIIRKGRHPVLEKVMGVGESYVANDTMLNEDVKVMLITGPNMAGKSSYLRQVGLIVFMAQMGSFVPAEYAEIGIVDRIFTRVGASDNLSEGESTFLVEMNETANILNNATEKSLILLDEIGRGTSTYDGLSIAWAVTEYIHDIILAKTLFATHYHELTELEERLVHLKNYHASVVQDGNQLVFLKKIENGKAAGSYGIEVAKMAGIPERVVQRAGEVLRTLERKESSGLDVMSEKVNNIVDRGSLMQLKLFELGYDELKQAVHHLDVEKMTPIQALLEIVKLKKIAEKVL